MGSSFFGSNKRTMRDALRERLKECKYSHFITLATNGRVLTHKKMRGLLKDWDARVNCDLNGPKWAKRPDERLYWIAFPEKQDVNPHWHLLAEVDPGATNEFRRKKIERLDAIAKIRWSYLMPQGSCDCKVIESHGVIDYVTKVLDRDLNFENFVLSREFQSN